MVEKIKLNGIDFNITELKRRDEEKATLDFILITTGNSEYHLAKEILSKKNLDVETEDEHFEMRVASYSYKTPNIESHEEVKVNFNVSLEELIESDELDVQTGLVNEVFRLNNLFNSLALLCERKGIFTEKELKDFHADRMSDLSEEELEELYKGFFKEVFNYDMDNGKASE